MECHYGRIPAADAELDSCPETCALQAVKRSAEKVAGGEEGGDPCPPERWVVHLSTWPWYEGTSLSDFVKGFQVEGGEDDVCPSNLGHSHNPDGPTRKVRPWQVFHSVGLQTTSDLRTLLS